MAELTLGQKIKKYRTRSNMTQLDLELAIQASQGSISRIENGQINPTKETLINIIKVLNLNVFEAANLFNIDTSNLSSLFNLGNKLNNSVELDELLQKAVNEISYELNLLGSFIVLEEKGRLFLKTFTQTWFTKISLEIIGKPIKNINVTIDEAHDNLMVKSYLLKREFISFDHSDFVVPAVSSKVGKLLQLVSDVKAGISLPLIYQDKSIGAIYFGKRYEDDFSTEISLLRSFSESVATAIESVRRIEELNTKLDVLQK
jgi:transcriptional regulator with XRE-family HTH domain